MHFIESGFGNKSEAFIERRYQDGINIIFSDENNKGKTLTVQGLMYSIGNIRFCRAALHIKNIISTASLFTTKKSGYS